MHIVNSAIKWSCYTSGFLGLAALTLVSAAWLSIEVLVMVIETTS